MYELKPCPFCGGKAELWLEFEPYEDEYTYDERNLWHCGCKYCGIDAQTYWEEQWAIDAWNTRTPKERGEEK